MRSYEQSPLRTELFESTEGKRRMNVPFPLYNFLDCFNFLTMNICYLLFYFFFFTSTGILRKWGRNYVFSCLLSYFSARKQALFN